MAESWTIHGVAGSGASGRELLDVLRERIAAERSETWFESTEGRLLSFVTNGERAMVMLLAGEDDSGEHAGAPEADGSSGGFVLENGQADIYPDRDTVPLALGLRIIADILILGRPPGGTHWESDR